MFMDAFDPGFNSNNFLQPNMWQKQVSDINAKAAAAAWGKNPQFSMQETIYDLVAQLVE